MTGTKLNRIDYDSEQLEAVEQAKPSWYRNLPGQMVGRSIVMQPPVRPPAGGGFPDPGSNPDQSNYQLLLSWQGRTDAPLPVSLSIRVTPIVDPALDSVFPPLQYGFFAGQNLRAGGLPVEDNAMIEARNTGFIDVTYGVGGDQKRALFDLRDGTFDFPPVSWIRVSAQRYAGGFLRAVAPAFDDLGVGLSDTVNDPIEFGASLHSGSHAGDYMPVFSSFMNRVRPGASQTYTVLAPPRAKEFLYGIPSDDQSLVNVTVSGAVLTRSRILGGVTPGSINQPYWGPGIPVLSSPGVNGEVMTVTCEVDNIGPETQLIYCGWRLEL